MADPLGPVDRDERVDPYFDDGEGRPGARRLLPGALAVLVMAVFAGGIWLAYVEGGRQGGGLGPVPLIRAAPGPFKHKPAEPGGMQIPGRHMLIFGEQHPKVEHLLPPPETPMPLSAPPSPPRPRVQAPPLPPPAKAEIPAVPAANPATAPLRARPKEAVVRPRSKPAKNPAETHPRPREAAAPAARARPPGTRLQLGALRSPEAARREWDRLKRANPKLLGRLSAYAVRADLGPRGVFYRIETAPFRDAEAAERLCAALKRRHVGCFLAH